MKVLYLLLIFLLKCSIRVATLITCEDVKCDEDEICCEKNVNQVDCCPMQAGCNPSCARRIFRFLENDKILLPGIPYLYKKTS
jgi:hypothetical protein